MDVIDLRGVGDILIFFPIAGLWGAIFLFQGQGLSRLIPKSDFPLTTMVYGKYVYVQLFGLPKESKILRHRNWPTKNTSDT